MIADACPALTACVVRRWRYAGSMVEENDDAELFRAAIGLVRKLPEQPAPPARPRVRPRARMAERDEADARLEFRHALDDQLLGAGDVLAYRRESIPPQVYQRLRRGEISAQDELDLHGSRVRIAEELLREFIGQAHRDGLGCVRIIHGKGLHGNDFPDSSGAPIMKNLVDGFLRHRGDVLAFHSAPPRQGGTGAVLVLLAPPKRR